MVSQEKENKKTRKLIVMSFPFSTNQLPFEITAENTLIPRSTVTNIIVCPFLAIESVMGNYMRPINNNTRHVMNANGDMSLHKAATNGDLTGAQEAVRDRKDLLWVAENEQGNIPLHYAVFNGHNEVASYLVDAYPQGSFALNHLGFSPLYFAVQRNDLVLVENMFSKLAKDDQVLRSLSKGKSILRVAIGHTYQEMVETILRYQPGLIKCYDEEGLTPLSYAASEGLVGIVSYIINKYPKSISIRNKDMTESYPIHKACVGCHVVVLKLIHAKNPDTIRSLDKDGNTIMHIAAKSRGNQLKTVVSFLLQLNQGRELLKKKDENGFTPLQLAINNRNLEVEDIIQKAMPL